MTATATGSPGVDLERSYRRLLRALPPAYRRAREREMVDVMLELSPPDRRRPRFADAFDIAAIAVRQWIRVLFLPSRGEVRTAAAGLAVIVPLLLAYPVGQVTYLLMPLVRWLVAPQGQPDYFSTRNSFELRAFLWMHGGWLVWAFWAAAIVCLLIGKSKIARFPAAAGTVVFGAFFVGLVTNNFQRTMVMNAGWMVVQIVAVGLLARPATVEHGRRLVPPRILVLIALVAGGLGVTQTSLGGVLYIVNYSPLHPWLIAGALLAAALASLWSATGRVVLPFLVALLLPLLACRIAFPGLIDRATPNTFDYLPLTEGAFGVVTLVLLYAGSRLASSAAADFRARSQVKRVHPRP
ncbi:hypothetical protein [Pengzhenrongella sicca]|uniref:Uncharacterized protein n=1 Tax=Pengzhenrongella sicca TaxID=2819238 RepID=A0A8A4ZED8_9MICO|nr:hypothetical protein [Pengzhenrongella sicca]QTE30350.1 hypothetical protein J4E96_04955 [Pengzhenrongella sicca]